MAQEEPMKTKAEQQREIMLKGIWGLQRKLPVPPYRTKFNDPIAETTKANEPRTFTYDNTTEREPPTKRRKL